MTSEMSVYVLKFVVFIGDVQHLFDLTPSSNERLSRITAVF